MFSRQTNALQTVQSFAGLSAWKKTNQKPGQGWQSPQSYGCLWRTLSTKPHQCNHKTGRNWCDISKSQKLAWTGLKPGGQQTNTLSCICSLQWNQTGEGVVASSNWTFFCQVIEQCGFDPLVYAMQHGNQKAKSWLTLKIQKSSFSNIIVVFQTKQVLTMKWTRNIFFHFRIDLTCILHQHSMRWSAHEEINSCGVRHSWVQL